MQLQEEKQHKQAQVATNRPSYREARWERAVKVSHINKPRPGTSLWLLYYVTVDIKSIGIYSQPREQISTCAECSRARRYAGATSTLLSLRRYSRVS